MFLATNPLDTMYVLPTDTPPPAWVFQIERPNYVLVCYEDIYAVDTKLILLYSKRDCKYNFYIIDVYDAFDFDQYASNERIELLVRLFGPETLDQAQKFYPHKNLHEKNYGF